MHGLSCDRCGKNLLIEEDVRYEMRVRITAGWDPPELMAADLAVDFRAEMARIIAACEARPKGDLEEEIAAERRYDLCPPCRLRFLERPFPG